MNIAVCAAAQGTDLHAYCICVVRHMYMLLLFSVFRSQFEALGEILNNLYTDTCFIVSNCGLMAGLPLKSQQPGQNFIGGPSFLWA